ncbi:hypothetical protein LPB140_00420 [Sphingorhabdus lutea]|uniref:Capsule biosynthesis protein n=1 Tax=Sphingorhabdus lutea TaxID=1913578 RepID=A0A1L3J8X8_9SPHN|nr:DUF6356 family protein [Sphingorhabdus lutea]APG61561.1 hypothetical protein LPB140_00420 [Sphingorhabdus lutea]
MNIFTDHPHKVGESYSEHLVMAGGFGWTMFWGGLACMVHAILPFLFEKTGSDIIRKLHMRMVTKRADLIKADKDYELEWVI